MKCGKIDMFLSIAFTRNTRLADVHYLVLRKCRKERKKERKRDMRRGRFAIQRGREVLLIKMVKKKGQMKRKRGNYEERKKN